MKEIKTNAIYCEDCIKGMERIPDGSVDAVVTDPPYGITSNPWDIAPPMEDLWKQIWRVLKPNGVAVTFGQEPFASKMRLSSGYFRYDWIWAKTTGGGFLNAKKMPLRCHEVISIHYRRLPTYNPQFAEGKPYRRAHSSDSANYGKHANPYFVRQYGTQRYPRDVLYFKGVNNKVPLNGAANTLHPTQKPTELLEYLIKTYTNIGECVLDPYMGSGTTAVACLNTGRNYIGFEMLPKWFEVAEQRLNSHTPNEEIAVESGQLNLFSTPTK